MPDTNNKTEGATAQDTRKGNAEGSGSSQAGEETRKAGSMSGTAGNSGATAVGKAKDNSVSMTEQAKAAASGVYDAVADKASAAIGDKKTELTGGLTTVVDTVRRMGDAITEGEDKNTITEHAAKYTEAVATKLEGVANYFDQADLRGVARDIESYARRNPAVFLGAAFALGVLAARFIKSSPGPNLTAAGASAGAGGREGRKPLSGTPAMENAPVRM